MIPECHAEYMLSGWCPMALLHTAILAVTQSQRCVTCSNCDRPSEQLFCRFVVDATCPQHAAPELCMNTVWLGPCVGMFCSNPVYIPCPGQQPPTWWDPCRSTCQLASRSAQGSYQQVALLVLPVEHQQLFAGPVLSSGAAWQDWHLGGLVTVTPVPPTTQPGTRHASQSPTL